MNVVAARPLRRLAEVRVRTVLAASSLAAAMVLSLVFYGTAINLVVLALVEALLMFALVCIGPHDLVRTVAASRGPMALALAALGYLVVAYRLTLSPDNSFAPSWVLASGPLAFIGAALIARHSRERRALTAAVFALVLALALNSCVRFLLFGERAHEPLADPNGYGSLIYLVWIPFVHFHLSRGWRGESANARRELMVAGISIVMLLALLATRSRTSVLLVSMALLCWTMIVAFRRAAWRALAVQWVAAAVAVLVWRIISAGTVAAAEHGLEFSGGLTVRYELIRAAFSMLSTHPLGIGIFCFPLLYPTFRSINEQDTAGLFVHNDYVQFFVEGGLPLLLLLILFVGAVMRRLITTVRCRPDEPAYNQLGIAMGLAAVCAHATVNFVFYNLPLGILIGFLAAYLFVPVLPTSEPAPHPRIIEMRVAAGALTVGWIMWLYLLLDVAIVGVLQGQPSLPFAAAVRADEPSMLRFVRVAQRLNGNRGLPALGEAVLSHKALRAEPGSAYLREQTDLAFQHALAVDPWNSLIYLRLAQFLDEFPPPNGRRSGESDEELLLTAIGLDPLFLPGIDGLLNLYATRGDDVRRYTLLRNLVYPWMPTVRRRDPAASDRYFDLLQGYADAAGDSAFSIELRQQRAALARIVPRTETAWFF